MFWLHIRIQHDFIWYSINQRSFLAIPHLLNGVVAKQTGSLFVKKVNTAQLDNDTHFVCYSITVYLRVCSKHPFSITRMYTHRSIILHSPVPLPGLASNVSLRSNPFPSWDNTNETGMPVGGFLYCLRHVKIIKIASYEIYEKLKDASREATIFLMFLLKKMIKTHD